MENGFEKPKPHNRFGKAGSKAIHKPDAKTMQKPNISHPMFARGRERRGCQYPNPVNRGCRPPTFGETSAIDDATCSDALHQSQRVHLLRDLEWLMIPFDDVFSYPPFLHYLGPRSELQEGDPALEGSL
ncbi:hypothetical protein U1Q18_042855 [Sarracenia purpurea var. burkii]